MYVYIPHFLYTDMVAPISFLVIRQNCNYVWELSQTTFYVNSLGNSLTFSTKSKLYFVDRCIILHAISTFIYFENNRYYKSVSSHTVFQQYNLFKSFIVYCFIVSAGTLPLYYVVQKSQNLHLIRYRAIIHVGCRHLTLYHLEFQRRFQWFHNRSTLFWATLIHMMTVCSYS